jgi:hypothetical protein
MRKIMYNEILVGLGFGERTTVFFLSVKYISCSILGHGRTGFIGLLNMTFSCKYFCFCYV